MPNATRPSEPTKLTLPRMGLGCWAFGGGEYWGPQSQSDVDAVVHAALDRGITYFDSAEAYNGGASETALGKALAGRRDRAGAIVGSKVNPSNTAPAALRAACEASLKRLGIETIDLYMVHWPINPNALRHFTNDQALLRQPPSTAEAFATLAELRQEGKIRHIGVSNFGVRQLAELEALGVELAANELPYGLLIRGIEPEILPACRKRGVAVIGYMALMQGLLSGRFTSIDNLPPARTRTRHFAGTRPGSRHGEPGIEAETWSALQAIAAVAAEQGLPVSDLALAWSMANPAVSCTLVGCRNVRQLEENARALELRLAPEVVERLDAATAEVLAKLGPHTDYFQAANDSRSF